MRNFRNNFNPARKEAEALRTKHKGEINETDLDKLHEGRNP